MSRIETQGCGRRGVLGQGIVWGILILLLLVLPASGSIFHVDNTISNGTRPYLLTVNLSNSSGTNNATWIFGDGNFNSDFSNVNVTIDNTSSLPCWVQDNASVTSVLWINDTANGTVNIQYGSDVTPSCTDITKISSLADDFNTPSVDGTSISTGSATMAAWGSVFRVNSTHFFRTVRTGQDHSAGGKIVKTLYNQTTGTWSGYTTIYDSAYDDRNSVSGLIGTDIFVFFDRCNEPCLLETDHRDIGYIKSTDGGNNWGSYNTVFVAGASNISFSPYGKIVEINSTTYIIPLYGTNNSTNAEWLRLLKTTDGGTTWSLTPYLSNADNSLSEFDVSYIGNNQLIAQIRTDGGSTKVKQSTSPDVGESWTSVVDTNLGTGATATKFISNYYDSEDNTLVSWFGEDVGLFTFYYSKTNATTVYNSATAYSTAVPVVSGGNYLGNPSITKYSSGRYLLLFGYGANGNTIQDYSILTNIWKLMTGTTPAFSNGNMIIDNGWVWNNILTFGQNTQLIFNSTESVTTAKQEVGFSSQTVVGASSDICNSVFPYACLYFYNSSNIYIQNRETAQTQLANGVTDTNPHTYKIIRNGSTNIHYLTDGIDVTNSPISTNLMVSQGYIHMLDYINTVGSMNYNWLIVAPYSHPEPAWVTWGEAYATTTTISCSIGWCYVASNYSSKTLLELDNLFSTDTIQGHYNATSQKYESHRTGYAFNQNVNVAQKEGYYYYFSTATDITTTPGSIPSITLKNGWNLVANYGSTNRTLSDLKTSIGANATQAQYYDRTYKLWVSYDWQEVPAMESFMAYVTNPTVWTD